MFEGRGVDSETLSVTELAAVGASGSFVQGVFLLHQGQDVVGGHDVAVLVVQHRVPANFAVVVRGARGDLLGRQRHPNRITGGNGGEKAQAVQSIVGEHWSGCRIHKKPGRPRDQQVPMGHYSREERIPFRRSSISVGIEGVAGTLRERRNVLQRHLAQPRGKGIANAQLGQ